VYVVGVVIVDVACVVEDLNELLRVGWLRQDNDMLVLVEQEQDWEDLGTSSRRQSRSWREVSSQNYNARTDSSGRNHSSELLAQNKIRRTKEEKPEETKRPEGVQGEQIPQAPKTDPTPTLRKQEFESAVGKARVALNLEAVGSARTLQGETTKDQSRPNPEPPIAPPPYGRQEPFGTHDDRGPVRTDIHPATGVQRNATAPSRPSTGKLFDDVASAVQKSKGRRKSKGPDDEGDPLPEDWAVKDHHYAYGRERLGAQKKHVDYWADDMRDQAKIRNWRAHDWDAKFRTFMRKALEFSKGTLPNVPEPLPPKVPIPPPPPPSPIVLEGARRAKERMERGENIFTSDLFKRVGMRLPELPPDPPELASNG
jgi:hypothetical protein